jgi:hypothetical protein
MACYGDNFTYLYTSLVGLPNRYLQNTLLLMGMSLIRIALDTRVYTHRTVGSIAEANCGLPVQTSCPRRHRSALQVVKSVRERDPVSGRSICVDRSGDH